MAEGSNGHQIVLAMQMLNVTIVTQMITLGIDLSSSPKGTAVCRIEWRPGNIEICEPDEACEDPKIVEIIKTAREAAKSKGVDFAVGIDAPFGWPDDFVSAVKEWKLEEWSDRLRDRLRFRLTDNVVSETIDKTPLSVSSDTLALPAMRAMALLKRHGVTDHSGGDNSFWEVYPAASLKQWGGGLLFEGYKPKKGKGSSEKGRAIRLTMLHNICGRLKVEVPDPKYAKSDHAFDALISSITVRLAHLGGGRTVEPGEQQKPYAMREGWIHFPDKHKGQLEALWETKL